MMSLSSFPGSTATADIHSAEESYMATKSWSSVHNLHSFSKSWQFIINYYQLVEYNVSTVSFNCKLWHRSVLTWIEWTKKYVIRWEIQEVLACSPMECGFIFQFDLIESSRTYCCANALSILPWPSEPTQYFDRTCSTSLRGVSHSPPLEATQWFAWSPKYKYPPWKWVCTL
jgi:hypothetical protein